MTAQGGLREEGMMLEMLHAARRSPPPEPPGDVPGAPRRGLTGPTRATTVDFPMAEMREKTAMDSDESVVHRFLHGDSQAFDDLLGRYQEKVYRLAHRMASPDADLDDIVQDTFLHVYRSLGSFRGESTFSTWIYRIATNLILMRRRSAARHPTRSLEDFLPRFRNDGTLASMTLDYGLAAEADTLLEREELSRQVRNAMDLLPELYRAPLVLRDLEGLSAEETAEILELSPELFRTRLHRGRMMMRGFLGHLVGGEK